MEQSPSDTEKLERLAELENDFQRLLEIEKLEAMAEFAAGAGHEINNPLTVISGRAQLLLREERDPERQHALALISAQAMRVYEMIADMMLFARPPRPELQPVDLIKLIDEVVAELQPRAARQDTSLCRESVKGISPIIGNGPEGAAHEVDSYPFPLIIEADPVQLQAALRAICQNSLEALQSGGHLRIKVSGVFHSSDSTPEGSSPSEAVIQISDDGPGIKPEERRHIFDPFYSARQAGRGLGLGLSKAWRIVTNHGGRIEVESEPGRGATFTILLPGRIPS